MTVVEPAPTRCRVALIAATFDIDQVRELVTSHLITTPGVSAVQTVDLSPTGRLLADTSDLDEAGVELLVTSHPCPERDEFVRELFTRDSWYAQGYRGEQADADFFAVTYLHERVLSLREHSSTPDFHAGVHSQRQDQPERDPTGAQAP